MKLPFPLLLLAILPAALFAQGPLTPPNAPGPTMRSLDQVEPRVPLVSGSSGVVVDANGKVRITQSGSYYLTKNLVSTTDGISIEANSVTVDLRGFVIQATTSGINIPGTVATPLTRIAVSNGTIEAGGSGISGNLVYHSVFEDLRVKAGSSQTQYGAHFYGVDTACRGIIFRRCEFRNAVASGIQIGANTGEVTDCVIEDCVLNDFTGDGIILGTGTAKTRNCTIRNCSIARCQGNGINLSASLGMATGNQITGCQISSCGSSGISITCASTGTMRGNRIEHCEVDACASGIGFFFNNSATTTGNVFSDNLVTGSTSTGIWITGSNNFVLRNIAANNATNYNIAATNTSGPIVTTSGPLATTGADAHPNANFSR